MGRQKKIDCGQLLLTVTDKKQTRPLVREGAQHRQDSKFQTELISGGARHQDVLTGRPTDSREGTSTVH
jgi:hypothetical protein